MGEDEGRPLGIAGRRPAQGQVALGARGGGIGSGRNGGRRRGLHRERLRDNLGHVTGVKAAAITALGRMSKGKYYSSSIVQHLLTFSPANVRLAALEALSGMEEYAVVYADVIAEYLHDLLPQVQAAAAVCLK